jgi:hypothetical protein
MYEVDDNIVSYVRNLHRERFPSPFELSIWVFINHLLFRVKPETSRPEFDIVKRHWGSELGALSARTMMPVKSTAPLIIITLCCGEQGRTASGARERESVLDDVAKGAEAAGRPAICIGLSGGPTFAVCEPRTGHEMWTVHSASLSGAAADAAANPTRRLTASQVTEMLNTKYSELLAGVAPDLRRAADTIERLLQELTAAAELL